MGMLRKAGLLSHRPTISGKYDLLTKATILVIVYLLNQAIFSAEAASSSKDFGICDKWNPYQKVFVHLNCLIGQKNFCCNKALIDVDNQTSKWSQSCCSEAEFVEDNYNLFMALVLSNVILVGMVLLIILASFSTIILTNKAAME